MIVTVVASAVFVGNFFTTSSIKIKLQPRLQFKTFRTMVYSFYDKTSSSGSDISGLINPTLNNLGASNGVSRGGLSSPHSLVFESEKGELVKCPATAKVGKSEICEAKALAALKNHSEAERRRRERINGHLATLRGLVPSTEKVCFYSFLLLLLQTCSFVVHGLL